MERRAQQEIERWMERLIEERERENKNLFTNYIK
jgi:hypothetical protein